MRMWLRIMIAIILGCTALSNLSGTGKNLPPEQALELYRRVGPLTDPGEHASLYSGLPKSMLDVCTLIKQQFIHPFDAKQFLDQLPKDISIQDQDFPSVEEMLEGLLRRDPRGLISNRKPMDRLIVACVHHSLLFASIFKHRGVPVRLRFGFAKYIGGNNKYRVSHAICEVWDAKNMKWFLVDPDRQIMDLQWSRFESAGQAWRLLRSGRLQKDLYISSHGSADRAALHLLCHDLSALLGKEMVYWEDPPIVDELESGVSDLDEGKLKVLDRIAELIERPDNNIDELTQLYTKHKYLQW